MRWPWSNPEVRESGYTDALVALLVQQTSGATLAKPSSTGALEASASNRRKMFRGSDRSSARSIQRGARA